MKDVIKLLEEDSSFQLIQPHNDSPCGLAFLEGMRKMVRGKYPAQTNERKAYEIAAKIYYELGFKDGQNECANVHMSDNVTKDNYDFIMKLLSLMGMSYMYVMDMPLIQKEVNQELKIPFHPGLNLVQNQKCLISSKDLSELKATVNELFERCKNKE